MAVWPYMPRGSITESLQWVTDVQRCKTAEQRRSLSKSPRQEFQYRYMMTPAQFGEAKLLATKYGASSLLVPLWPDFREPGPLALGATLVPKDTADSMLLFPVDSSVLIWESATKYEVNTIHLNSTNPAYPYLTLHTGTAYAYTKPLIVPLRTGEFVQEFEATRTSFTSIETEARLRVQVGDDHFSDYVSFGGLYSTETYSTHAVVTDRSLVSSGVQEAHERKYEEVDSVIGGAYRFPTLSRPNQSSKMTWHAQTLTERRALLYWLHSRKGMWKSFWVPSWSADVTVTAEIGATDTSIEIADIGLRNNAAFPLDIMILTKAGARIYCHVTGATAGSAGKEVLGLSAQVGTHLYTWDISIVSFLTLFRFGSDRIEINHDKGGSMTASAPIVEVPA